MLRLGEKRIRDGIKMVNGIEIRAGMDEQEETRRPGAALLFLMAGIFGILLLFRSLPGISFSEWVVYPATALLCWAVWYTYYGSRRAYLFLLCGAVVAYGAVVFGMEDVLREQLRYIAGCLTGGSKAESMEVTETVLVMTALFTFFLAMSEFLIRSHRILYLLTTGFLLLSPFWGIRAGAGAVLLLALFQTAFWILQTDGLHSWRLSFDGVERRRILGRSSLAGGIGVAAVFLVLLPVVSLWADRLYTRVYDMEGVVSRTVSHLTGQEEEMATGGNVGRGNQYRTGTPHLELETDVRPGEALYLCGFQGDEYLGSSWSALGEEELFETVEEKLGWQMYSNGRFSASNLYNSMYFLMNMNRNLREPPLWRNLRVRHLSDTYENLYAPYYSQRGWGWRGSSFEGYLYWYYEQGDMAVAWDDVREDFSLIRDWYLKLRDAYTEEMRIAYTKVPVQLLPRLTNLCSVNHCDSLEEITAFILYTLQENTEYTMTPGWAPVNEDIAEYFLFESGRGYCEHYATAATLMYRLYGIPARYASGYVVQPSAFLQQEEGTWKAVATDEDAHAWVEIFLEDYGWTPVEVTPTAGGGNAAHFPGFNQTIFRKLVSENSWELGKREFGFGQGETSEGLRQAGEGFFAFSINWEKGQKWLWIAGACGVYTLVLVPLFLDYRRLRHLRRMGRWGCRKVFSQLLKMLRFAGVMEGYDGTERDFALKLKETTGVSQEETAKMQEIVWKAAYGKPERKGTEAEEAVLRAACGKPVRESAGAEEAALEAAYCRRVYFMVAEAVYRKLKGWRKILFRYWQRFL